MKDKQGNTALMKSSTISLNTVKFLVENSAIINEKNNYGQTALKIASEAKTRYFSLNSICSYLESVGGII